MESPAPFPFSFVRPISFGFPFSLIRFYLPSCPYLIAVLIPAARPPGGVLLSGCHTHFPHRPVALSSFCSRFPILLGYPLAFCSSIGHSSFHQTLIPSSLSELLILARIHGFSCLPPCVCWIMRFYVGLRSAVTN